MNRRVRVNVTGASANASITFKVSKVTVSSGKCTSVYFQKPSRHLAEVRGPPLSAQI